MRDDAFKSHAAYLNHESDKRVAAAFSGADNSSDADTRAVAAHWPFPSYLGGDVPAL
jgi:hypothetical protein